MVVDGSTRAVVRNFASATHADPTFVVVVHYCVANMGLARTSTLRLNNADRHAISLADRAKALRLRPSQERAERVTYEANARATSPA